MPTAVNYAVCERLCDRTERKLGKSNCCDRTPPARGLDKNITALTYKNLFILNSEVHTYIEPEEETDEEN
ncbi:hypothetical protein [Nostoc sp.]|uniref:hypothetical protein n=1 Tax=Nostoc sp. TaxID=1180 RepID=UPI002FF4E7B0